MTTLPRPPNKEDATVLRRHVVADILSARNAHRTAQYLTRKGFAPARAFRDGALRSARHNMGLYRAAAIAKATGSAS